MCQSEKHDAELIVRDVERTLYDRLADIMPLEDAAAVSIAVADHLKERIAEVEGGTK